MYHVLGMWLCVWIVQVLQKYNYYSPISHYLTNSMLLPEWW